MKKIVIGVLAFSIVLSVVVWMFGPSIWKKEDTAPKPVTITMYGLWESEELIKPSIEAYTKLHPNVSIKYELNRSTNYRTKVQTKIANNEGPDVFIIHNSWLPMFLKPGLLSPMPTELLSYGDFVNSFNPIVKDTLSTSGRVYALPRGIDGLALYYNTELLENVGLGVPKNWKELADAASIIAVSDTQGKVLTAGVALGTTGNVDHWSDILGLLFMQKSIASQQKPIGEIIPAQLLEKPNNKDGAEVLQFYTGFVNGSVTNGKKVWDKTMASSTEEFARGRLAFYFAPSWRAAELRQRNPQLKFGIAPVPQLPDQPPAAWATFWAYAVSSTSPNQNVAWDFVKFLTSAEQQKALFQPSVNGRLFGLPYANTELQKEVTNDPYVGPFINQAGIYQSWYLNSGTFDQGVNDNIIKYYEDAVNGMVNENKEAEAVLETVQQGVDQVLSEYREPSVPSEPQQQ